jgi:HEAT repeat protein
MSPSPAGVILQAQVSMRRATVRRQLQSVASGKTTTLSIEVDQAGVDVGAILEEVTRGLEMDSAQVQNLVLAFVNSGTADRVVERLTAKNPDQRIRSARVLGALRMYEGVPWLAALLESRDRKVSDAAARALGKIGGTKSAAAIVTAIQRRGINRRLVAELARSAPDLFIEALLLQPQRPSVRPALAMAAGLRRRRASVGPLIALLEHGTRRERAIACRALGWIGAGSAVPVITAALQNSDWKTRMSAAKALGALRAVSASDGLKYLTIDRNTRVRAAARMALNRVKEEKRGA